jgi:cardiolipin-specific phospholipase
MARHLRQWWTGSNSKHLIKAEHELLSALVEHPFTKQSVGSTVHDNGMNIVEFHAPSTISSNLPTVVLAHGFGSGLGFFYRNIDPLLHSGKISRVICLDWLGMGGSARPSCWQSPIQFIFSPLTTLSLCNSKFTPPNAVDFFLDPLDDMLRGGNLVQPDEPIWLVAHSLGGYLAGRYCMRIHQESSTSTASSQMPNISKLILASPVGFQPVPSSNERISASNLPPAFRLVDALWSANVTPQALVRLMGSSRGKSAVKRALDGRIPHLKQQSARNRNGEKNHSELDLLADYLYHVTVAPPSGEYAMNSLLEPAASESGAGVYARESLGGGEMAKILSTKQTPIKSIKVLFGDNDWMRFHEAASRKEMESISANSNIAARVDIIQRAGHHLYLDNVDSFVEHILGD